jgi:large repetitive protein
MKRARLLIGATVVALVVFVAPANATHVQCGATLTQSTTLDSDVVCTDAANSTFAITILANDVRLDLGGHTVKAAPSGTQSGIGAFPAVSGTPVSGTRILNGTVEGFDFGVQLSNAVQSHVRRLTITANSTGIEVAAAADGADLPNCQTGVTNCIVRNVISVAAGSGGILATGPKNNIWGNTIRGAPSDGIHASGDQPRIQLNHIEGCAPNVGIAVSGYSTYAVIWQNTIDGCSITSGFEGIEARGSNAKVRRNVVTGTNGGINVTDTNGLIAQNDSSGNAGNGIGVQPLTVDPASNVVRDNNADNNGGYGFSVGPGTIDGGGNHASGNTQGNCTGDTTFCAGVTP